MPCPICAASKQPTPDRSGFEEWYKATFPGCSLERSLEGHYCQGAFECYEAWTAATEAAGKVIESATGALRAAYADEKEDGVSAQWDGYIRGVSDAVKYIRAALNSGEVSHE